MEQLDSEENAHDRETLLSDVLWYAMQVLAASNLKDRFIEVLDSSCALLHSLKDDDVKTWEHAV